MEFIEKTLEYLDGIKERFDRLEELIFAPEIIADSRYWLRLNNERASIEELASLQPQLKQLFNQYNSSKDEALYAQINALASKANELILKSSKEGDDAYVEISPESNKDEPFCADLVKMYEQYLVNNGYNFCTEGKYAFSSAKAYERLKHENGIHKCGAGGATVLIVKAIKKQEAELNEKDIRTDLFHSSGAGGQNVNKVESAVRLTHIPTGVAVTCQDSRSQLMNKASAHESLRAKVDAYYKKQSDDEMKKIKRERAKEAKEKIRVYNYSANTVTDLRSGISQPLKQVLSGEINALILKTVTEKPCL